MKYHPFIHKISGVHVEARGFLGPFNGSNYKVFLFLPLFAFSYFFFLVLGSFCTMYYYCKVFTRCPSINSVVSNLPRTSRGRSHAFEIHLILAGFCYNPMFIESL